MSERGKYDCVVCGENIARSTPRRTDPQRHYACDRLMGSMWIEIRKERDALRTQLAAAREQERIALEGWKLNVDLAHEAANRTESAERERDDAMEAMRYFRNAERVLREGFHKHSLTADPSVLDGLVKQCKELAHRAERMGQAAVNVIANHIAARDCSGEMCGAGKVSHVSPEFCLCRKEASGELDVAIRTLDASACTHTWVDARNSTVLSGEVCLACGAVRAGNAASAGEG